MIDVKTVFILGAGSSALYGFPTGRQLRTKIINNSAKTVENLREWFQASVMGEVRPFVREFNGSHIQSIDKFLNLRKEYYRIGKLAIALEILKAESNSKFTDDLKYDDRSKDWYFYLYNKMLEGIDSSDDYKDFGKNAVSFVTFNYDRSLDQYLYKSFSHSFHPDIFKKEKIKDIFPFEIVHVYGAPELMWQSTSGNYLEYNILFGFEEDTVMNALNMSDTFKIIYDDRSAADNFLNAQKKILEADRIFFLGFGYADENLEILNVPDILNGKDVYGTAKGFTVREIEKALAALTNGQGKFEKMDAWEIKGYKRSNCHLFDTDCVGLLRAYL